MTRKQRDVMLAVGLDGASLEEIKRKVGVGHGTTQALNALVARGRVVQRGDRYVRGAS